MSQIDRIRRPFLHRRWLARIALGLIAASAASGASAQPVAVVTELHGTGRVSEGKSQVPVELLHELAPGAVIALDRDARAVLVHMKGVRIYEIAGPGRFRATPTSLSVVTGAKPTEREVPAAIRAYRLKPVVATQASVALRNSQSATLEGPRGGVLDRSELVWRLQGDVTHASARIADAEGRTVAVLPASANLVDASPLAQLAHDAWYALTVGGEARGKPVTLVARFRIVNAAGTGLPALQRPDDNASRTEIALYAMALDAIGADATAGLLWDRLLTAGSR